MKDIAMKKLKHLPALFLTGYVLYRACVEFFAIAWGTGNWLGEFSLSWAFFYYSFAALCILVFSTVAFYLWNSGIFAPARSRIIEIRQRMGVLRWVLWTIILIAPVWFFQYTALGFVFQKLHIRIFIWVIVVCLLTILSSRHERLAGWNEFLVSLILTASAFSIAASLKDVSGYPFSLGWSEGNRLWDYSVLFGRDRYIYPAEKKIPAFLDFGRSLIGGLPFLFKGTTIIAARFWIGLTLIVPYLLLGIALFRAEANRKLTWFLLVLWAFLFLKQGPIHAPLVLGAALVALAWRAPLWFAVPLMTGAGYFMVYSRFTWVYAPALWIIMLEIVSAPLETVFKRKAISFPWLRLMVLVGSVILGAFMLPAMLRSAKTLFSSTPAPVAATPTSTPVAAQQPAAATPQPELSPTPVPADRIDLPPYLQFVVDAVKDQPLLWYRLLPNSTYDNGILLSLLFAIAPLSIVLAYLSAMGIWKLSGLQKTFLILPLLAFLAVGLVASTKIGGGGDLHNMDMFLIGLLFAGALAWQNGGRDWVANDKAIPSIMKVAIVALLVNSSIAPLIEMRTYNFGDDLVRLRILLDADRKDMLEMLPTQTETEDALQRIQSEVDQAKLNGDVLFMDQRQLLTFGYITGVPLVPDYEKKFVMNQALSGDADYFQKYYADLAAKRFSLIITEPLRTPIQDSSYQFGEENNAWVKWVANPTLCYYEPLETLKTVRAQLLVPKQGVVDCSAALP